MWMAWSLLPLILPSLFLLYCAGLLHQSSEVLLTLVLKMLKMLRLFGNGHASAVSSDLHSQVTLLSHAL